VDALASWMTTRCARFVRSQNGTSTDEIPIRIQVMSNSQPRLLAPVKQLADNAHFLPKRSRDFAQSLVASAISRDKCNYSLSDKQLLEVSKLNERIRKEKR